MTRARSPLVPAAVALCFAFGAAPAFAGHPRDARITAKVEGTVGGSGGVEALVVDTADGRVTLRGRVESEAARSRIAIATRRVAGVREVRNLIEVGGERASALAVGAAIATRGTHGRVVP